MRRPPFDLTRGHLLLAFGVAAGSVGLLLVIAPAVVPAPLRNVQPSVGGDGVYALAGLLGVVLVLTAVFRVVSRSSTPLDRSPIHENTPENAAETAAPTVGSRRERAYERLLESFEHADQRRRYVAMYGRRANHATHVPSGLQSMLEEVAATAAATYETAAGCDRREAREAVDAGRWTDDRVAAAFLASDPDGGPTFEPRERLLAWIAPRYTVERRLDRTLDEIESLAGGFLSYDRAGSTSEETSPAGERDASTAGRHNRLPTGRTGDGSPDSGADPPGWDEQQEVADG